MSDINIQMKHHDGTAWNDLFPKSMASITLMGDGRTVEKAITDFNNLLSDKVDKESGKKLTSNDFTNSLKTKLEGLQNHSTDISNLQKNKSDKSNTYSKSEVDSKIAQSATGIPVSPDEPEGVDLWFEEI